MVWERLPIKNEAIKACLRERQVELAYEGEALLGFMALDVV